MNQHTINPSYVNAAAQPERLNAIFATVVCVDLGLELQRIYDSEINVRISWLWDGVVEGGRDGRLSVGEQTIRASRYTFR
jgi:hypothetical protein